MIKLKKKDLRIIEKIKQVDINFLSYQKDPIFQLFLMPYLCHTIVKKLILHINRNIVASVKIMYFW